MDEVGEVARKAARVEGVAPEVVQQDASQQEPPEVVQQDASQQEPPEEQGMQELQEQASGPSSYPPKLRIAD
eukprot:11760124-Alexandrium_andersonii.AAC.1